MTDWPNVVLAFVAVVSLSYSFWQGRLAERHFRDSQQQTRETLEASQRPYLHPTGTQDVAADAGAGYRFDFEHLDPGQVIKLTNGGNGLAFNVRAAVVQPRPRAATDLVLAPRVRSFVLAEPLAPGATEERHTYAGRSSSAGR